jgi:hypothetical protein
MHFPPVRQAHSTNFSRRPFLPALVIAIPIVAQCSVAPIAGAVRVIRLLHGLIRSELRGGTGRNSREDKTVRRELAAPAGQNLAKRLRLPLTGKAKVGVDIGFKPIRIELTLHQHSFVLRFSRRQAIRTHRAP